MPGLFACALINNGLRENDTSPGPSAEPQATPAAQPSASATADQDMITIFTLEGGEQQIPDPGPDTFSQLLEQNVEQGIWERGQGFTLLLRYLTGELAADEIPGFEPVLEPGLTMLLRQAREYVAETADSDEYRAEIARLLAQLTPTQADLDRLTGSSSGSNTKGLFPISQRRQDGVPPECVDIFVVGFSAELDPGTTCYQSQSVGTISGTMAVYYPNWWQDEPARVELVELTLEALLDSEQFYAELGEFGDINVAFSLSQPSDEHDTLAYQEEILDDEACQVTVLPLSDSLNGPAYQQTIAHEAFHCYQDWNLNLEPYKIHEWWAEGSAEYFSNLVYPRANAEHVFLESYYLRSPLRHIFQMDYHNFIFFQYLGNQLGTAEVLSILEAMATSATNQKQAEVLAAYPNMDQLFQDFVVATMSDGVTDSGGGQIVQVDFGVIDQPLVDAEGEYELRVDPFVAGRYSLRYQQERRFLQQALKEGALYDSALASAHHNRDSWGELPPEIRSSCQRDQIHAVAVTSVGEPGLLTADVTSMQEASCDPCVLGTWDMDPESFEALFEEAIAAGALPELPPGGSIDIEVEPHLYYQFDEEGVITSQRDAFTIVIIASGEPPVRTIIDAQGLGTYSADGEMMQVQDMIFQTSSVQVLADGVDVSAFMTTDTSTFNYFGESGLGPGLGEAGGLGSSAVRYVCTDEQLEMTAAEGGLVTFDRVDAILPTLVPTPND